MKDQLGNICVFNMSRCSSLSDSSTVIIDTFAPYVTNVTSLSGYYKSGMTIKINVTFSEVVYLSGSATMSLDGFAGSAVYSSGSGSQIFVFVYTVLPGDSAIYLTYRQSNSFILNGILRDLAGNNANLSLPNPGDQFSLSFNSKIIIDTYVPSVFSIYSNSMVLSYIFCVF